MAGMLQILTYVFCFYLVVKGIEIWQIGFASSAPSRDTAMTIGVVMVIVCLVAAIGFATMQDNQAQSLSRPSFPFTPSP